MDILKTDLSAAIEIAATAQCSFCNKDRGVCKRLISGYRGAFICDECVALCALICDDGAADSASESEPSSEATT